jgi:hypothetical protein
LARDNAGAHCAACQQASRQWIYTAPDVPAEYWEDGGLQAAFAARHMGKVIRAYRYHEYHGRKPLPQDMVASWFGITQSQLSRIEAGAPIVHLDRLIQWSRLLHIPEQYLWFKLPDAIDREGAEADVRRNDFLLLTGATAIVGLTAPLGSLEGRALTAQDCVQWLAWELWQHKTTALHPMELPRTLAVCLARLVQATPMPTNNLILVDSEGRYSFAHASFVDFFIAQRIFGDISTGNSKLLAMAQTSHDTDHVIREFVSRDAASVDALLSWMRDGATPVLRVNSAGILAKLGAADLADTVVTTLKRDGDTRQLYLTAVVSRVLAFEWEAAARIAVTIETDPAALAALLPQDRALHIARKFANEVTNPRDGAARWLSVLMLGQVREAAPDAVTQVLQRALREEPNRENLRAIGSVLAGSNPLSI